MIRKRYLLFFAFTAPLAFSACGDKNDAQQQQGPAAVAVNAIIVSQENVTGTDTYPGTVTPLNEVELRPQVAGYITNIFVQDGQKVIKGQKLYEIDRSKYAANMQQAQANLHSAKANLARVEKDVQRYETLLAKDAIALQQVDYARADLQTAKSQVAVAQAQVQSASTDLGYAVIEAPFSGTIGISQVRVGTQVSPGQPLLNTISSLDPIAVDFVINETEIPRFIRLKQGPHPDSLFTIRLSDGSVYERTGKLVVIDRAIGRQSGTITVRLQFQNPQQLLIPGMTVNVQVLNQDIGEKVTIPYKAVTEQLGEYFVYVIKGDSVVQQKLELGTRLNENVVVRNGLKSGDKIVTEGIQKLRQGTKVLVN